MTATISGTTGLTAATLVPSGSSAPTNGIYLPTTNAVGFVTNSNEVARFDSSGNLLVGTTTTNPAGSRVTGVVLGAGGTVYSNALSQSYFGIKATSGTNVGFFTDNGSALVTAGSISSNGSTTSFNTSSDYRLKTNVTPLTTAQSGPIIDALKPSQFTWKEDNSSDVGFIAHEMQAVIPRAVNGEKDAVDAEGKPIYQQVAVSSPEIIAYLVAELQSVRSRLAGLESTVATQATEIATLKAKVGA